MITRILAGLLLAAAAATAVSAASPFPKAVRAGPPTFDEHDVLADAVNGGQRTPVNTARDGWRHPAQSLAFWGLQRGDTILELDPGGGYWTEILAPFAKATGGRYIAAVADLDDPKVSPQQRQGRAGYEAKFADPAVWGKVETVGFGPVSGPLAPPGTVDFILTSRSIHNFMWAGTLDKTMGDTFAALRPGGVLAVEEHRADPRPMITNATDGYVAEETVIAAAEKAGFKLDARSEINANPKDSKDHPFGVWTLPPTRQSAARGQPPNPAFDHSRFDTIGESDRMTLRFRKPK